MAKRSSARPAGKRTTNRASRQRVLIVTGSRSEFGLLRPVIKATAASSALDVRLCVAGEHLVSGTIKHVASEFDIDHRVQMQRRTDHGHCDHASAFARGAAGFVKVLRAGKPDWLVVLGDRIEAFAAASAAAVAGVPICHIHGGDRAEGLADEAMRHAISKLAHLHCAASKQSAARLLKMGEPALRVHITGSPAIDDLGPHSTPIETPADLSAWPAAVILIHPGGFAGQEAAVAGSAMSAALKFARAAPRRGWVAVLPSNSDPGQELIAGAYRHAARSRRDRDDLWFSRQSWPRQTFLAILAMLRATRGVLIGNSSAGLIEAAALGVPVVNLGDRQAGREKPANVVQCDTLTEPAIFAAIRKATRTRPKPDARYGDGRAGPRIAALLARGPQAFGPITKHNTY